MNEMVERVARAICDSWHGAGQWDSHPHWHTDSHFLTPARAAIAAMREPTEAMWRAAETGSKGGDMPITLAWPAMIDEALK